jgi:tRNA(Ile)-lysidine synthetase-like protein
MVELSAASGSFRFGALRVQWRRRANPGPWRPDRPAARGAESYDADRVGETVILRHWKPGDRFQPIGSPSPAKLQDLFTNEKVPRAERHRRAIATTAAGKLFWVEGLRIAEEFKLRPDTRQRLDWASSRP